MEPYQDVKEKLMNDIKEEEYAKGFWCGFTSGILVVTVIFAFIRE